MSKPVGRTVMISDLAARVGIAPDEVEAIARGWGFRIFGDGPWKAIRVTDAYRMMVSGE